MSEVKRVEQNDVEYLIIESKGVVVCKLWDCSKIAEDRIEKYMKTKRWCYPRSRYSIEHCYIGIAKCAPEDTFDEDYGKKLALLKAKEKRGKAINNALKLYIRDTRRTLRDLERYGMHSVPSVLEFLDEEI